MVIIKRIVFSQEELVLGGKSGFILNVWSTCTNEVVIALVIVARAFTSEDWFKNVKWHTRLHVFALLISFKIKVFVLIKQRCICLIDHWWLLEAHEMFIYTQLHCCLICIVDQPDAWA